MDSKHFKGHRVPLHYGVMTFWKCSEASGMVASTAEAEWDICEIVIDGRRLPIKEFKLETKDQSSRDITFSHISSYLYQLNYIFEAGRKSKAREIHAYFKELGQ